MTRQRRSKPSRPPECGTVRGYQAHRRNAEGACTACKAGWAAYLRGLAAARLARMGPADHGRVTSYNAGCRCELCKAARSGSRSAPRPLTPDDPRHGSANGYRHFGCRCERCRAAAVAERQALKGTLPPGDPRHGTANGYLRYSCRCDLCRAGYAASR